jgi:hypothetical protein
MESFKIGKETIVLSKDGDYICGELLEVNAIGVTLKITRKQVFSPPERDTDLTLHEKDYCFIPMTNIIIMNQEG